MPALADVNARFAADRELGYFWQPMTNPAEALHTPPVLMVRGEGVHVEDARGHRTIDGVAGLWCVNLGYSCQSIKDAISRQLDTLPFYNSFRGTSHDRAVELSVRLKQFFAPEGMVRSFFGSGGSDAVETCLKLARQYHHLTGAPERNHFISLSAGYHGTHFGGASVGGMERFKAVYGPMLPNCSSIPAPWPYRNPFDEDDPERLAELCCDALEREIAAVGAGRVAAFIMEPVIGSGGVVVPPAGFMPKVRAICDQHGILLIADEVITAFGRTGAWTGSRLWSVKPDMMTCAKGLSNGYVPMSASLVNDKVAQAFESDQSSVSTVSTGYTYSGHPVGCAAALAAMDEAEKLDVAANAQERGEQFMAGLMELQQRHEVIGDVRGTGLMYSLDLVASRASRQPVDRQRMASIHNAIYRAGASVRASGNYLIISPPLIVSRQHIEELLNCLAQGFAQA